MPSRGDRSGVCVARRKDGSWSQRRTGSGRKEGAPDHARIERTSLSAAGTSEKPAPPVSVPGSVEQRTPDDRQARLTAGNGLVCPDHEPFTIEQ